MKIIYAAAALAALILSPAYAACVPPSPLTNIPDGTTATSDDILEAQKAVVAYSDATNAYLDCIKNEHQAAIAAAGEQITTVQYDTLDRIETQKHNAAVEQLDSVVNRFNEQVRIFRARSANTDKANSAKTDTHKS